MKLKQMVLAGVLVACPVAFAQTQQTTTKETTSNADGSRTEKTTTTTVNGSVQSYEAGKSITIVGSNGQTTTYTINSTSDLPKDLVTGKTVTLRTYVVGGSPVVKQVTYRTTTDAVTGATSTEAVTVTGNVQAYEAGKSITIIGNSGAPTTYSITSSSQLPKDLVTGKTVTVRTTTVSGSPVVQQVTYKTTTNTTTTTTKHN